MSASLFFLIALVLTVSWTAYEWRRGLTLGENEWTLMNDRPGDTSSHGGDHA